MFCALFAISRRRVRTARARTRRDRTASRVCHGYDIHRHEANPGDQYLQSFVLTKVNQQEYLDRVSNILIFITFCFHPTIRGAAFSVVAANRQHVAARQRRQTAKTRAVDANAVVAHSAEASAVRQRAMAWLTLCAGGGAIAHFKRWSDAVVGGRIMRRIHAAQERSVKIMLKLLR